jgi:hypothetical protein
MVENVKFKINRRDLIDADISSRDAGPLLMKASIHVFKDLFLNTILSHLNGGMLNGIMNS